MSAMNYQNANSGRNKKKLLNSVMLAVLAVSIVLAWTMVRTKGESMRNAIAVLDEIQNQTLGNYWPDEGLTQWYMRTNMAGEPLGWSGLWVAKEDDIYKYVWIQRIKDRQAVTICTLSPDGLTEIIEFSTGKKWGSGTAAMLPTSIAKVNYAAGRVQAWASGVGDRAVAKAPPNYLPQGLTEIAAHIVNQTQQEATFKTILLDQPVARRQVFFEQLTMTPQGDNTVRLESKAGERIITVIYHMDPVGLVSGFNFPKPGFSFKRVTFEKLAKTYPEVMDYRAATKELSDQPDQEE